MTRFTHALPAAVLAGGLAAAVLGFGAAPAAAQPAPPGEPVPAWAPPKPAEHWAGQPVVWFSGWGGRWGVWLNGAFMPLTSNPVTNGG